MIFGLNSSFWLAPNKKKKSLASFYLRSEILLSLGFMLHKEGFLLIL